MQSLPLVQPSLALAVMTTLNNAYNTSTRAFSLAFEGSKFVFLVLLRAVAYYREEFHSVATTV